MPLPKVFFRWCDLAKGDFDDCLETGDFDVLFEALLSQSEWRGNAGWEEEVLLLAAFQHCPSQNRQAMIDCFHDFAMEVEYQNPGDFTDMVARIVRNHQNEIDMGKFTKEFWFGFPTSKL